MAECEKLSTCAFFKEYETNESKKMALKGFIALYCTGDQQDTCIRKKISTALGGAEHVPVNMMPNGRSLPGTSVDDWSDEVKGMLIV